jgi:hypothetical protein
MEDRSAYRKKFEARLDQMAAEIDMLQAKAAEASADARIEYERQVEALRKQQADAREQLRDFNEASGEAWKDLAGGLEKAWNDFADSVRKATGRFG